MKPSTSASPARVDGRAIAVAVAGLVAFAYGWSPTLAARPRYGGTLRLEIGAQVRALDPGAASFGADEAAREALLPLLFETLTRADDGNLQGVLADSWQGDAQGRRWQFHLRSGVKLHDGTVLTPAQVAVALRSFDRRWTVTDAPGVVSIECDPPLPDLPWQLADARHVIAVPGPSGVPLGTGPFRAVRLEGGRLVLAANTDHRDGRPFVDAVEIEMGRSSRDELTDLEIGRADLVPVLPQDVHRLAQRGLQFAVSRPRELVAVVFDTRRPAASQEALRTAVSLGVDRSAVCTLLLQRQAAQARGLLPDWLSGYAALFSARYDRTAARSAVASLPSGSRALSVQYVPGDLVAAAVAERVAVDLRDVGLTVQIAPAPVRPIPPPDARLVRVSLPATTPGRALGDLVASLDLDPAGLPGPGSPLEEAARFEQALLDRNTVVPLVHVSRIYGIGRRLRCSGGPVVTPSGSLNLANAWLSEDDR